ncbi:MAG: hypothetical protein KDB00_17145 [Planctomycetales bacterium]|nr:hypothetical protein [Planctomycetales bacterium]
MIQIEKLNGELEGNSESIRQIAILLYTLPERTHRVLLGQLGSDDKQRVADELAMLEDVDALEQYRVLKLMRDELQAETSSVEKVESEIQDEIQIGRARVSKKRSNSVYRTDESAGETAPEMLVGNATVDSATNAPIQESNDKTPIHSPVNSLGGNLTDWPQSVPMSSCQTQADVVTGRGAIQVSPEMMRSMFEQFRQTQAAGVLPTVAMERSMSSDAACSSPTPNHVLPIRGTDRFDAPPERVDHMKDAEFDAAELAERIDRFLIQLPPRELCRALGLATTKQAFLVLCGLPNEKAEQALELLPRRKSRKVRSDMRRMGQLQLCEIDSAKQVIAQIALRITTRPESFAA